MERLPNWELAFNEHFAQVKDKKFSWKDFNCCHLAAGFVKAITGVDKFKPYKGKFRTERGAYRLIKKLGFNNLYELLVHELGEPVVTPHYQRGDVVMYGDTCGVCLGQISVFVKPDGFYKMQTKKAEFIFRI